MEELTREQLIEYLTIYQRSAREHTEAVAAADALRRQIEDLRQNKSTEKKRRGRPPKVPRPVLSLKATRDARLLQLQRLEEELAAARRRELAAWRLYKQLDEMSILSLHASRRLAAPLLELLQAGRAETLEEAMALLGQGRE